MGVPVERELIVQTSSAGNEFVMKRGRRVLPFLSLHSELYTSEGEFRVMTLAQKNQRTGNQQAAN